MTPHQIDIKEKEAVGVQSVRRALKLLRMIALQKAPVPLAALTELSGLNRTTVWRLLSTLELEGFVERDVLTKNYDLGQQATTLCTDITQQYEPLIRLCRPIMERCAALTKEDVLLTVPRFGGVLTIDQIQSEHGVGIRDYTNIVSGLHCSSNGKLLLSYLPPEELDLFLQQALPAVTPKTITDPEALKREISRIAKAGYGISYGENGAHENGVSTSILQGGQPIAFLNISGPDFRLTEAKIEKIVPEMRRVCAEISGLLAG